MLTTLTDSEQAKVDDTRKTALELIKKHGQIRENKLRELLEYPYHHPFYAIQIVMGELKECDIVEAHPIVEVVDYKYVYRGE